MKSIIRYLFILMVIVACSVQFTEAGPAFSEMESATGSGQGYEGLPQAARYEVSAALGRDNRAYHFSNNNGGLQGRNQAQSCEIDFSNAGLEINDSAGRWGLSLATWGYGSDQSPVEAAVPTAAGNRVEYRRGPLTEWYVNGPLGLQQGFTLESRPLAGQSRDKLRLSMNLAGGLTAMVDPDRRGVSLYKDNEQALARYAGLTVLDAKGHEAPAWLEVEENHLSIVVDDSNLDYPLVIDPFIQKAKLTASDGAAGDQFGHSVSIDGDTVVVGAYGDDSSRGAVYVFIKPVAGWGEMTQTAKLTASDGTAWDMFGLSVFVSGDTVVVGAYGGENDRGSAYVFVKPGGGWSDMTQTAELTTSDGAVDDQFGYSVSVSGDTVVVGAGGDDDNGDHSGSAYVFVRPVTGWANMTQTAKLTASDGAAGDMFGNSVTIGGDTVVIGAGGNDDHGAAYVFVKPSGDWATTSTYAAKLTASDGAADDWFGGSLSVSGDTVVVGIGSDEREICSVYVFVKPGAGWTNMTETAKLSASDGAAHDYFGWSVSVSGGTVLVGAPLDNDNGDGSGSAYVFVKPGTGWADMTETAKLTASDGAADDGFGGSVSISGDALVVGAYGDDGNQGSAYVFDNWKKTSAGFLNLLLD